MTFLNLTHETEFRQQRNLRVKALLSSLLGAYQNPQK